MRAKWIAIVVSFGACGARGPGGLKVVASGPTGEITGVDAEGGVRVTFSRPMVAPGEVGKPLSKPPLALRPAFDAVARWIDRQTLVVVPKKALPRSTEYSVGIPDSIRAADGATLDESVGFSFVVERPAITDVDPAERDRLPPVPSIGLQFNQPVRAEDVARSCAFDGREAVAEPSVGAVGRVVVRPASPLGRDVDVKLACRPEIHGAEGPVGLKEAFETTLHTYGDLRVTETQPAGNEVGPDDAHVRVAFSNPLEWDSLRGRVAIEPRVPGFDLEAADSTLRRFGTTITLEAGTDYTITIKKGVRDRFGQALADDRVLSFHTGDAEPRLSIEKGVYAVETGARYPVFTRNLTKFDVACAKVPGSAIVGLLTGEANYDAWWDAGPNGAIDWKKAALKPREKSFRIEKPKNQWHEASFDLGEVCAGAPGARGLYFAEFRADEVAKRRYERPNRLLANVTDIGLLAKVGAASGIVWAVRLGSGEPVAGARVEVRDLQGKVRFRGATDADGVAELPGAEKLVPAPTGPEPDEGGEEGADDDGEFWDYDAIRARRVVITVREGDDLAILDTNWNNGVQIWNFGVRSDLRGSARRVRGHLQTDRGIYKPGETVHLRGLARALDPHGVLALPTQKRVSLEIEDSWGGKVAEVEVPLTKFGGFHHDLPIDEGARVGDYHVRATVGGQTFRERFSVEEYRPVAFEVRVAPDAKVPFLDRPVKLKVEASYLYGAPVRGGKLAWSVMRRRHALQFGGAARATYQFEDAIGDRGDEWGWWYSGENFATELVADGEAELDGKGRAAIVLPPDRERDRTQDYIVEATVTDESGQAVTKRDVIVAHRHGLYLGLHPEEFVQATEMPFQIQAIAVAPDGARREARATLTLSREESHCRYEGAPRATWTCDRKRKEMWKRDVAIPATGAAVEKVLLHEPGFYVARLQADDERGGRVLASEGVYVIGKGEAFWSGDESDRMSLVASKSSYASGETARLVPRAQMAGATALLTLERDGILLHRVQKWATTGEAIELPIEDRFAPNVFASVALVRGRTGDGDAGRPLFRAGVVEITVDASKKRLAVEVATDRPTYKPGEKVEAVVRVRDATGAPIAAEVALSVADEGVLQLVGYKTPDPMARFYAPFGLGVETSTTWNRVARRNDPNQQEEEEGGDGGDEREALRSRFLASAFWAPALVTDASGEARVAFDAPDNLTAWRVMAVAADAGDRFGSGEMRFTVRKPLQAMPVVPRFLSAGDRARVGVVVHAESAGHVVVTAEAEGASLDETRAEADVPAGGRRPIFFGLRAKQAGEAVLTFRAAMGGEKDAVKVRFPVERPLLRETMVLSEGFTREETRVPLSVPKDALRDDPESGLEVSIDPSGLASLDEGLRWLIRYPYG